MPEFRITRTPIENLLIVEPQVFGDNRGFFVESYNKRDFAKIGINCEFVQDNHSKSKKAVLRGFHFQTAYAQDKLIRVIKGSVYDAVIDLRQDSATFGQSFGLVISAQNKKMFFIPKGFAHAFLTLEDETEFMYKVTDYYHPEFDSGIIWNDSDLNINWPLEEYDLSSDSLSLSEKDKKLQTYQEYLAKLRK